MNQTGVASTVLAAGTPRMRRPVTPPPRELEERRQLAVDPEQDRPIVDRRASALGAPELAHQFAEVDEIVGVVGDEELAVIEAE